MGASRDLALGFRGNGKEIVALCAKRTHQERTFREDWPVVDGNWRLAGEEEIPCELVREQHFLGSRVPAKQLRSQRKGIGIEREREREREQDGVGEARRARSVPGAHLIPVTAPKC
jgi:1,4-alpha-glucan branching enzyme